MLLRAARHCAWLRRAAAAGIINASLDRESADEWSGPAKVAKCVVFDAAKVLDLTSGVGAPENAVRTQVERLLAASNPDGGPDPQQVRELAELIPGGRLQGLLLAAPVLQEPEKSPLLIEALSCLNIDNDKDAGHGVKVFQRVYSEIEAHADENAEKVRNEKRKGGPAPTAVLSTDQEKLWWETLQEENQCNDNIVYAYLARVAKHPLAVERVGNEVIVKLSQEDHPTDRERAAMIGAAPPSRNHSARVPIAREAVFNMKTNRAVLTHPDVLRHTNEGATCVVVKDGNSEEMVTQRVWFAADA